MPNWCEGSLKVRGTKENMTRFILEGLRPVGFLGEKKQSCSWMNMAILIQMKHVGLKTQEGDLSKV